MGNMTKRTFVISQKVK